MVSGKFVGAVVGLIFGGFWGLILGFAGGHFIDSFRNVLRGINRTPSPTQRRQIETSFLRTCFMLLGHIAKADGRVSEAEITHTEQLMARMGLTPDHRRDAIGYFQQGTAADFDLQATLAEFNRVCGSRSALRQTLIGYLVTLALADGAMDAAEQRALERIAEGLGIPVFVFRQLLAMITAQAEFHRQGASGGGYRPQSSASELQTAYAALGLSSSATESEVKRTYRRLMSENHPDKLIGQGMPDDMVRLATERSQEISRAYELIRSARAKG